jgi:hypothetical protein
MIQTILSGMELVGVLSSGLREVDAFNKFWKELTFAQPQYKGAQEVFRNVIRNKSAHLYLVHTGIRVTKDWKNHLTRTEEGYLSVDLLCLFRDFRETYECLMHEMIVEQRPAPGYTELERELTERLGEIQKLVARLPVSLSQIGGSSSPSLTDSDALVGPSGTTLPGTLTAFMPSIGGAPAASATELPPRPRKS